MTKCHPKSDKLSPVAVIGITYPPVLDHRCLSCLQELSVIEKAYWNKRYADDREKEPCILRVSCVKCLRKRGKFVPIELQAVKRD